MWRQAHQFRARSSVSTRLLAIARNKAIAELRRRRGEALGEEVAAIEDPQHDPEAALQTKDRSQAMRLCLTQLSPEHREMIDLVYYHEVDRRDRRHRRDSKNAVKTRTFNARKRLADLLDTAGVAGLCS